MKKEILCLFGAVAACASDESPRRDVEVEMSEAQFGICSDVCGFPDDPNYWDCIDASCGSPGGGVGGGGGGYGGGGGDSCSSNDSCRSGCFCKDGVYQYGTYRGPGFCTYVQASPGACSA